VIGPTEQCPAGTRLAYVRSSASHCRARSGKLAARLSRVAAIKPRSVTSRAGVTSKAQLATGEPSGTTVTVSIRPSAVRPVTVATSSGRRAEPRSAFAPDAVRDVNGTCSSFLITAGESEGWEKAAKALCPTDVAEARPKRQFGPQADVAAPGGGS